MPSAELLQPKPCGRKSEFINDKVLLDTALELLGALSPHSNFLSWKLLDHGLASVLIHVVKIRTIFPESNYLYEVSDDQP
mmetsp:Transcript_19470/g.39964  ORF Transcript_19470/g.39964 Transcript_19470/m.39964 type:complete len:80 (+) Transcript_19470:2004-2243(+)